MGGSFFGAIDDSAVLPLNSFASTPLEHLGFDGQKKRRRVMNRFAAKFSKGFLGLVVFLLAGVASAGGSEDRPDRIVFAGNAPALVAELRLSVLAGLPGDFAAAAKTEMVEVVARAQEQEAEWEVAARFDDR
jgi:hypothetical protein